MKPTVVWEGPAGLDWGRSWMECMLQRVDVNYKFVKTTKNLQSYDFVLALRRFGHSEIRYRIPFE